ncbi:HNH endonuclease [Leptospira paudalimensis]|uniref:HNH endonuclease n=1 Tax=Leptospira paudalimensis TaxID=2950024 RepID=A0ABT3M568_9LEPT|nr:HNH endonuclease [Leptospira paudalimensis]MCW7503535.1 HNH endonuclease [Leptospira paudalimensis]
MRKCIYCRETKEESEFSLEHIIPQFLGGAYVDNQFKTREVCRTCNNNLGLFVDGLFAKNSIVYNNLTNIARYFNDDNNPKSLPLTCIGISDLSVPGMSGDEICEMWLGPFGEQIYWIRLNDDKFYSYVGGNPINSKRIESVAYFLFSENSNQNQLLTWLTFKDAFQYTKVKKIMCTIVDGADPKDIGFSDPDNLDKERISYFHKLPIDDYKKCQIPVYIDFDIRFLSKLAIGISYCLFGSKIFAHPYSNELHLGLWHRIGGEYPKLLLTKLFSVQEQEDLFKKITGLKNLVVIIILKVDTKICISLNINSTLNWIIAATDISILETEDLNIIGDGIVLILAKDFEKSVQCSLPEFINHILKNKINADIALLEN